MKGKMTAPPLLDKILGDVATKGRVDEDEIWYKEGFTYSGKDFILICKYLEDKVPLKYCKYARSSFPHTRWYFTYKPSEHLFPYNYCMNLLCGQGCVFWIEVIEEEREYYQL